MRCSYCWSQEVEHCVKCGRAVCEKHSFRSVRTSKKSTSQYVHFCSTCCEGFINEQYQAPSQKKRK